jgi:hypothetical protein
MKILSKLQRTMYGIVIELFETCVKIGKMAKSIEDIDFIISTFMRNSL